MICQFEDFYKHSNHFTKKFNQKSNSKKNSKNKKISTKIDLIYSNNLFVQQPMSNLTKNEDKNFVGYEGLIEQQKITLKKFEKWAEEKDWKQFGPINQ